MNLAKRNEKRINELITELIKYKNKINNRLIKIENNISAIETKICKHENTYFELGRIGNFIDDRNFGYMKCASCGETVEVFFTERQYLQSVYDEKAIELEDLNDRLKRYKDEKQNGK